jgi:sigma-E factor negative regulatory protein RseC
MDCISHTGIVKEINNNRLLVSIVNQSACASCHAKGACTSLDSSEKLLTISKFDLSLQPGEQVLVKMHKSLGLKAVFLGYGLPFIIFLFTLLLLSTIYKNELFSGLGAIASLILYYLILKLFNKKVQSAFTLEAERAGI